MHTFWHWITGLGDKVGFGGTLIAAAGCPACFPALAGVGAAVGLGFLSQWEGVLVSRVIPAIAIAVMLINIVGYFQHRRWQRTLSGLLASALVFIGALTMRESFLYPGLALMLGVSIRDIATRRSAQCPLDTADAGMQGGTGE